MLCPDLLDFSQVTFLLLGQSRPYALSTLMRRSCPSPQMSDQRVVPGFGPSIGVERWLRELEEHDRNHLRDIPHIAITTRKAEEIRTLRARSGQRCGPAWQILGSEKQRGFFLKSRDLVVVCDDSLKIWDRE